MTARVEKKMRSVRYSSQGLLASSHPFVVVNKRNNAYLMLCLSGWINFPDNNAVKDLVSLIGALLLAISGINDRPHFLNLSVKSYYCVICF